MVYTFNDIKKFIIDSISLVTNASVEQITDSMCFIKELNITEPVFSKIQFHIESAIIDFEVDGMTEFNNIVKNEPDITIKEFVNQVYNIYCYT